MNVEAQNLRDGMSNASLEPQRLTRNRTQLRIRLYLSLLLLDIVCIGGGVWAAEAIFVRSMNPSGWAVIVATLIPIYVLIAANGRAFSSEVISRPGIGVQRALQALTVAAFMMLLGAFYLKTSTLLSRGTVGVGMVLALSLLAAVRWRFLRGANRLVGGNPYAVALILDDEQVADVTGYSFVLHANLELEPDDGCPHMFNRLARALAGVDRVVVACPPERRAQWAWMLKGANIRSEVIAPELANLAPLGLDQAGGMPTMIVADGPLKKVDVITKRAFDIALSSVAIIFLSPLFLAIALLVKASSPGPVFFIQTRIGHGNRMFSMLKFRSMRTELSDSEGGRSAARDDDRITSIGRFLRRTSLDELPQLINVFYGNMSIVGPRPHALGSRAENKLFWEVDRRYWQRHAAKPGLTGLAQVRGFRGATESEVDLTNRLQSDLEYVHQWSIWRDLVIICRTMRVIVHRNAY